MSFVIIEDLNSGQVTWKPNRPGAYRAGPGQIVMKFGEQLRESVIPEYQWSYLDYDGLKQLLKTPSGPITTLTDAKGKQYSGRQWVDEDETKFVRKLDAELDKVFTKKKVKSLEITRRIQVSERHVLDVVSRLNDRGPNTPGPGEEEFVALEQVLSDVITDVHDLAKFVQVNYTGFYKIIKKHDKLTGWHIRPAFDSRLKAKPFYKGDYDASIVKLSKLYDLVRTRGNPVKGDSAAGGSQANFVRSTTKYWVHPDNVMAVKLIILKHLPVLVFNPNKEFEAKDSAITSIYYDNPDTWELYEGRLKKTEGAEAIRLRWYGGMDSDTIFVERKTHREDWTGEKSVKARFAMKEKNVNAYMRGDLLPVALFQKARKDRKRPAKSIDEDEALASEVQWSVLKHKYRPVCRSFYNRTAFQLPADARVRISLDTELTMVREDNLDGVQRSGDNWRRMDIGIDYPFSQLPASDVVWFPYAVLEVKLQTQHGQEPPAWVRQLISSHLVEAVPKFSKFIHGCACLFPDRINLLPYWMPQMDVDIRKPETHDFGISRPGMTGTTDEDDEDEDDEDTLSDTEDERDLRHPVLPRNGGTNGESSRHATGGRGETRPLLTDSENQTAENVDVDEAYPIYDSDDEYDENYALEEARRVGGWTYYSTLIANQAHKVKDAFAHATLNAFERLAHARSSQIERSERLRMFFGNEPIQTKKFKAPPGKKIYVPIRVEPKVYFAAERTFLGWLEYSIYISTIAATLLNFGSKENPLTFIVPALYTVVAVMCLLYSVFVYLYRSRAIRERRVAKYHDEWGPTILCLALLGAILVNFVFELRARHLVY
ncbi:Vacuolar transporter chaperone 4 [Scedosporium apiospermum]|uniref:Vacuolar transporter chaperone complex subunit 4 n=1 Tax=Pseudallescheria apiosperma TaxID=563466 RepID=A0A084GAK0_PSEDA|nr:Vacuolar transporter chaperone 4 [Scedosporium apiospermum]KEZ44362.1 Vacuolar transporter chaperone 4 [Scedosporium apiospermum]